MIHSIKKFARDDATANATRPILRVGGSLFAMTLAVLAPSATAQTAAQPAPIAEIAQDSFDIRFRADTLVVTPVLSAIVANDIRTIVAGEDAHFETYSNYPAFIDRGEIRIFRAGQSPEATPLVAIGVNQDGRATWSVPADSGESLYFTYRVVAKDGKFDETVPQELTVVSRKVADNMDFGPKSKALAYGVADQASKHLIDLHGLMATVTGRADPSRDRVNVSGQVVPVDADGIFVAQQIVPHVDGAMTVVIERDGREIKRASQSFDAPKSDWLIVGQGDLTFGHSYSSGPARIVSGDTLTDGSYAIGRAAFYAKGVINEDIRLTASFDTDEVRVKDLFSNLDRKDPRQLLRRLNSEQYYPTYGDDSTLVEDAPTQGRFYLRAQKGPSQLVVGNFTTQVTGSELAQLDRGLFGALVDINSGAVTSFGERKAQFLGFASDPGTIPGREEYRGTGGSLFFLKRQDVSVGSERVRVEVRDRNTGLVLESVELHAQQDYDFDPIQGRLTLLKPLASTVATGSTVREGSSTGNVPVLVVRYEYTPSLTNLGGYTVGGRGSLWLGDQLRLGVTTQRDTSEDADQTLIATDAMFRIAAGTYLKGEVAQTKGLGFGQSNSVDGGLNFTDIANPGSQSTSRAWRSEVAVNFAELMNRQGDHGDISAYYENRDKGFSSIGQFSPAAAERWGIAGKTPIGTTANISVKYDELSSDASGVNRTGVLDLAKRFRAGTGTLTTKAGLRYEDRTPGLLYNSVQNGSRVDGALEVEYKPLGDNYTLHAFGQTSLDHDATRSRNNRAGAGLAAQLTERLSIESEVSGGDGGLGSDIQLNHRLGEGSEAYVGYALFADRTDTGLEPQNIFTRANRGTLTAGGRRRFSDSLSVYGENRIGIGGSAPSLTRSFGLRFDPTKRLSVTGSFENGKIDDATTGLFRRTAASVAVGYTTEDVRAGTSIEVRNENGIGREQTVWLLRNNLAYAVNADWRFIGEFNLARADNDGPSVRAAEFTEAIAGFAWRPIDNDRVNGLLRVQYFEDLGPVGQLTGSGQTQSPKQRSTVFSADVNYDLAQNLTVGAKYGYRQGKVSLGRDSAEFVSSEAHLAVVRLDYNIVKEWDAVAEGRALWVTKAHDVRTGALGAIYRHVGNNVKIGVGYSWSDFSDDLTDQSYTSHGPFFNILGKF